MAKSTLIKSIYRNTNDFLSQQVTISGWIRTLRASNAFGFIEVNDGSFFKTIQIVFDDKLNNFKEISKLPISSSITVVGTLVATPDAKQPFEIQAQEIVIEGMSNSDYPLQKKRHTFEYLRTIAHLRPRSNAFSATFRVRSVAAYAIHKFFQDQNFVYTHTPIITGSDCEGAGEMFRVTTLDPKTPELNDNGTVDFTKDFFGKETNLTVSGQLNAECFALAFRNIYTFGPTFRAENSNTTRHAAEFWMIEPEIAFADLQDDMELAENMLKYVIKYVMDECPEELQFFNQFVDKELLERLNHVVSSDFARVTYTEAVEILEKCGKEFSYPVSWGIDLQTEHERYLTEEHFKKPLFVTDYPKDIKAFYMRLNEDGKTVAATDLLVPGIGEIIGGSQREERLDVLKDRMSELGLKEEDYWWYLELRKYGETKHAGFGLGFERLIMYITGMTNIRDVIPFPRTPGTSEF
ncbi:asparaginyl-tRNA synthetase [Clostridium saccharoperbutylacetonicum]|uniref:Asparagine--tRNA ligase n=1 Tax=Clostridium saccharoperbutylacetonicum N1-4(HMT) TaxID=931276 RepID=M1M7J0_9CLOT|nr:asparagine--tRNA ligase [Clostridium saccharoperbutylacetonicum]AGF53934.1 asparagine--tRNA ligase AsnS [Clostridium saccharoperbutylacetonicum N1-4(HMT)]NRT59553.1 asparaginyl-tRNA synthetase [Clostridium saccharoperbutylacetonicum]NSB28745.1 asparaginyl-tRNA synthetase [Clostridium saccharoperbutylacetonicum]NSB42236.1 asparaginyl-tRNA synthetase [Clostridium saccharoperbutylacetonicum]